MKNLEKYIDNINYIREKINPLQMIITSSSINSRKELRNGIIVAIIVNSEDEISEYEDFVDDFNEDIDNIGVIFFLTTKDNASDDDEIVKGYIV
ncbi:hypothetical protein [Agathobacter rectalis]|jgi:hypothetical protein|uniref:Uncharacterized protein n=1 Tax=Agathobacter rectalis TaxID=39491 RepID=A0A3E4YKW0_9FIRM|nr:hypothetical protein [Agathobacter rectalis]MCB7108322.1 hypothetical protein [Agathobacter rectalis]MCG4811800.1 hypothetical protein [Agathobacter rectalis]RGM75365.1 hypothetical protein DXB99_02240 [Agathobacter rectalis]